MIQYVFFLLGISGFIVFYAVLAHLSARMGEGLRLPGYYRIYYIAILVLALAVFYGWYHTGEKGSDDVLIILLTIGNLLAIAASHKYWWWLKEELWMKKNKGEGSNE
ncbi:Uncharacterised protein [uncultured archaeon]|nr:Uncharacterised protein [uncultured archaeon]